MRVFQSYYVNGKMLDYIINQIIVCLFFYFLFAQRLLTWWTTKVRDDYRIAFKNILKRV